MSFLTLKERKKEGVYDPKASISQVFKSRPKEIPHGLFNVTIPSESHQADILYMPTDNGYKCALSVIDVASRYKDSRALKTKTSKEVTKAKVDIYTKGPLTFPKKLTVDPGSEFKGEFKKEMEKHGTKLIEAKSKKHVAMVDRMNRTIAGRAFMPQ